MKVRMKVGMSGTHNGEPWPAYGELFEVDDVVGERLIAKGLAESSHAGTVSPQVETEAKETVAGYYDDEDEHQTTGEDNVEERPASKGMVEARPAVTRTKQKPAAAKKR